MASVQNDIVEIRRTVYGRDMRKPIVDALMHLKENHSDVEIKRLNEILAELDESTVDWIEHASEVVFVNYEAETDGSYGLILTNLEGEDYRLMDNRQGDTVEHPQEMPENDYSLVMNDEHWDQSELEEESYVANTEIPHQETYVMVLDY